MVKLELWHTDTTLIITPTVSGTQRIWHAGFVGLHCPDCYWLPQLKRVPSGAATVAELTWSARTCYGELFMTLGRLLSSCK